MEQKGQLRLVAKFAEFLADGLKSDDIPCAPEAHSKAGSATQSVVSKEGEPQQKKAGHEEPAHSEKCVQSVPDDVQSNRTTGSASEGTLCKMHYYEYTRTGHADKSDASISGIITKR